MLINSRALRRLDLRIPKLAGVVVMRRRKQPAAANICEILDGFLAPKRHLSDYCKTDGQLHQVDGGHFILQKPARK